MSTLFFDFETTNLDKGSALNKDNHIVMVAWTLDNGPVYHEFGNEFGLPRFRKALESATTLVAHNAKFELQWLTRMGVEWVDEFLEDTMLMAYVLAGNRKWDLSLDGLAAKYGLGKKHEAVSGMIGAGICPSLIPNTLLAEYCMQDVILTRSLYLILDNELTRNTMQHIAYTRHDLCKVLADVETKGIKFDIRRTIEERDAAIKRFSELQAALDALSGGLNWSSPKQIAEYLYGRLGFREATLANGEPDRTDAGQPRTDQETILGLRATRKDQKEFLSIYGEFAGLKKRVQTLSKLGLACEEADGIIHVNYNQSVTQTHRLSSSGRKYKVQGQNIDRDMKRLVVAHDPDFYVMEADGVQLEFRGGAQLTGDPVAIKDIVEKKDIHKFSGSVIFQKPESEIVGELRTAAKAHTFKPLFNGNSGTPREKAYYAAFRERYNVMYNTQRSWAFKVLAKGELRTDYGMRFYWPNTKMTESGYITNSTNIFNYPIQSFCTAEVIPISTAMLWYKLKAKKMRSYIFNSVHDSVVLCVHKDEVDEVVNMVKESFCEETVKQIETMYEYQIRVPLGVEIKVGTYWGDGSLKKVTYEYYNGEYI